MIEHVSLRCSDSRKSRDFYQKALAPIGYALSKEYGDAFGFKQGGRHDFWISPGKVGTPNHVAFTCATRDAVDAFYEAAIQAGGRDNGPPGMREGYGYAAFVFDLDDHNIEAICFDELGEGESLTDVQRRRIAQAQAPKRGAAGGRKTAPRAKAKASSKGKGQRTTRGAGKASTAKRKSAAAKGRSTARASRSRGARRRS